MGGNSLQHVAASTTLATIAIMIVKIYNGSDFYLTSRCHMLKGLHEFMSGSHTW